MRGYCTPTTIACLALVLLAGCERRPSTQEIAASISDVGFEELSRTASPDSAVEAVVTRVNAGATTGYGYRIDLVPRGGRVAYKPQGMQKFTADRVDSLSVRWSAPRQLEIRYAKARILDFSNFWHSRGVQNWEYIVELKLAPLHPGSALQ